MEFFGPSNSGKTTAISEITKIMKARGFSVATVKSTHRDLDYESDAKDSMNYLKSGSSLSIVVGKDESVLHFPKRIPLFKILNHIEYDFMIVEGEIGFPMPKVLFLKGKEGIERLDNLTIAIVGDSNVAKPTRKISSGDFESLAEFVISNALEPLPGDDCGHCGLDCKTMLSKILRGEKTFNDCTKLSKQHTVVEMNGKRVPLLPFISSIISDVNGGILKNLKDMEHGGRVKIEFDFKN